MISLSSLNKLIKFIIFLNLLFSFTASIAAVDIWKKKENKNAETQGQNNEEIKIESPILSDDVSKITIEIDEEKIDSFDQSVIGIFDPEENNFNLNMWLKSDGSDIKKILKRINKLKLSKLSEDLLFQVLFTNAYPPSKNLKSEEFLKIKIDWLINHERYNDLETLLRNNPKVGNQPQVIKVLINEYLSTADIKSACEKINFIGKETRNDYLDEFTIYCLTNDNRKEEALMLLDLMKERGFKNKFFENKINFLLGFEEKANEKILDNNLLNFYLSHITNKNFKYEPNENTNKYIWRYLSSANLIQAKNFEDENVILIYEQAAAQSSFENDEIFKIYLQMDFSFNQLVNSQEIYKNLPNYKARALIYQSILLSDNDQRKIDLAFLLKDLFLKDKIFNIYAEELVSILNSINQEQISEDYIELVNKNLNTNLENKIKFDNEILHRSKIIKHFLDNDVKVRKTEKDFKSVYKKIKKNKKYFISIKDIVVLESLEADGVSLPKDLDYSKLSSELTIPKNLYDLVSQNQLGLVMLKIIEIIGEDDIRDLDPETIYFLNKILNDLNLKKIRNNILSEALPVRI